MRGKPPKQTEYKGLKVDDSVKLKIVCVPEDHKAVISSINQRGEFKVLLTSNGTREANGQWGPLWFEELEKA